jgi:purine-binding chemotaxis protein CheW
MVIVETEGSGRLAILADSVHEVIDLAAADVLPAPEFGVKVRAEYLLGLGKVGDKLVLVIDSKRLLSKEELLAAAAAPLVEPAEASA